MKMSGFYFTSIFFNAEKMAFMFDGDFVENALLYAKIHSASNGSNRFENRCLWAEKTRFFLKFPVFET